MEKKKILIIDDSGVLCETMQSVIEGNGPFEVETETDSIKALEKIRGYRPDLIMLDILMPNIDGVTIAVHLKNDQELKDIPVMFLTALADEKDLIFGNTIAGYHVATKDSSKDKLFELIHKFLPAD